MRRRPPISTPTDTLLPSTTLFRSAERLPELLDHQIAGEEDALDARAVIDLVRLDDLGDHRRGRSRHTRRSEEHTSELQSLMRNSYAVFCVKTKQQQNNTNT